MDSQILMSAISCLVSLTISAIFNWVVNRPKQIRLEKEDNERKREEDKAEILNEIRSLENKINSKLEEQDKHIVDIQLGIQASIKNELKIRYDSWIKKGYAPIDAKDDLERMYQIYHKLGANGVMDKHRERFLSLPEQKYTSKKRDNYDGN